MSKTKRNTLLLLSVAGFLIVILAVSLPGLVLFRGQPFLLRQIQPVQTLAGGAIPGGEILTWLFRGVLALAVIVMPFLIGMSFFSAEGRRRLLIYVGIMALLLLGADYLRERNAATNAQPAQLADLNPGKNPADAFSPGTVLPAAPPPAVTLVAVVVVWIIIALLLVAVIGSIRRARSRRLAAPSPLQELAVQAQTAIDAIGTGQDLKTTIVTCYREMSRVVREEKDLSRGISMTPREFEARLVAKGLPGEAVATLTRLFEQVRYGHLPAGGDEDKLALACLADILIACTKGARGNA